MLIGELAASTRVSTKTLRFYEAKGLLPEPPRTPAGYREYPRQAVARVAFIKQAQAAGLTLAQIDQILAVRDGGRPPCNHVSGLVDARLEEVTERLHELERVRAELLTLRERLADLDPTDCRDADICAAISAPRPG